MIPKLNHAPRYEVIVPSTGKPVFFRPYLVKEEKVLLTAFESKDRRSSLQAIFDTVVACLEDSVDPKSFTLYDVQYIFNKIRGKSAGEVVNLKIKCSKCQEQNPVVLNIDNLKPTHVVTENLMYQVNKEVTLELHHPRFLELLNNERTFEEMSESERIINTVAHSVVAFHTENEKIDARDEPDQSIIEFIEELEEWQFRDILKYVQNAPTLGLDIQFKCKCGHDNHYHLKDDEHFF